MPAPKVKPYRVVVSVVGALEYAHGGHVFHEVDVERYSSVREAMRVAEAVRAAWMEKHGR